MQPDQSSFIEGEALRLAQQGNAAALEFLYRAHSDRVYADGEGSSSSRGFSSGDKNRERAQNQ
jgi:hypothetical protein